MIERVMTRRRPQTFPACSCLAGSETPIPNSAFPQKRFDSVPKTTVHIRGDLLPREARTLMADQSPGPRRQTLVQRRSKVTLDFTSSGPILMSLKLDDINSMAFYQFFALFANPLVVLAVVLIALLAPALARYYFAARRPKKFPPGPQTIPFLGNLHQLPLSKSFLKSVVSEANVSLCRSANCRKI